MKTIGNCDGKWQLDDKRRQKQLASVLPLVWCCCCGLRATVAHYVVSHSVSSWREWNIEKEAKTIHCHILMDPFSWLFVCCMFPSVTIAIFRVVFSLVVAILLMTATATWVLSGMACAQTPLRFRLISKVCLIAGHPDICICTIHFLLPNFPISGYCIY